MKLFAYSKRKFIQKKERKVMVTNKGNITHINMCGNDKIFESTKIGNLNIHTFMLTQFIRLNIVRTCKSPWCFHVISQYKIVNVA